MDAGGHQGLVVVGGGLRHLGQVEDEVADLAEELVLVDVPLRSRLARLVGARVEQRNALEFVAPLDGRRTVGIADELRVVELDDGRADLVGTWREVDDGALREGVAAVFATASAPAASGFRVPAADCGVDCLRCVTLSRRVSAEVEDVAIELVVASGQGLLPVSSQINQNFGSL